MKIMISSLRSRQGGLQMMSSFTTTPIIYYYYLFLFLCCCMISTTTSFSNSNNNNNYRTTTTKIPEFDQCLQSNIIIESSIRQQRNLLPIYNYNNYNCKRDRQQSSSLYFNVRRFSMGDNSLRIASQNEDDPITSPPPPVSPADTIKSFSPSYLVQIDKYRGYQRKTVWLKRIKYNNITSLSTTTSSASSLSDDMTLDISVSKIPLWKRIVSEEMIDDVQRRSKYYKSDWTDAFVNKRKVIPGILFLYFTCLSPAVSFGTIASQITLGNMGIVEFLLSSGISGMLYAILCGQPMTFIAPTGLTLAFISGLYRYCSVKNLPFFPVYSWVGIWASIIFILLGLGGSSQLIRFCTRFTDEIFNALLSLNFIYEAFVSIKRNFQKAIDPTNLTMPFIALMMALITYFTTLWTTRFESSKYFNQKYRSIIKDFAPVFVFISMTYINQLTFMKQYNIPTLAVSNTFQLAMGRQFFINLNAISTNIKLLCIFPAMLLSCLFFMDQNISVRVVNNVDNKLKKGSAYNVDMVALGIITGLVSLVGLPWMCGATVQSLSHVRAMTETRYNNITDENEIVNVTETRTTGFIVHALIASTLFLLPLLTYVPIPVVSGIFLFLGRKLMSGNSFLQRIRDLFIETIRLPDDHPIKFIGRKKTLLFTSIQIICLYSLWIFKQNNSTAIFFPSVIVMLMLIRSYILPKLFTETELIDLGDPTPQ